MSLKVLKLLAALFALVLIASACGGDDDDDEGGAQPAPSEQTAAPAPDEPDAPDDTGDGDEPAPDDEPDAPAPDEPDAPADTGDGDGDEPAPEEPVDIGFDEPRGDMFIDFHRTFDRTHPSQPLDVYCTATPDPDSPPQATDRGITEDSITIVHLRTKLEELEGIGFAIPSAMSSTSLRRSPT